MDQFRRSKEYYNKSKKNDFVIIKREKLLNNAPKWRVDQESILEVIPDGEFIFDYFKYLHYDLNERHLFQSNILQSLRKRNYVTRETYTRYLTEAQQKKKDKIWNPPPFKRKVLQRKITSENRVFFKDNSLKRPLSSQNQNRLQSASIEFKQDYVKQNIMKFSYNPTQLSVSQSGIFLNGFKQNQNQESLEKKSIQRTESLISQYDLIKHRSSLNELDDSQENTTESNFIKQFHNGERINKFLNEKQSLNIKTFNFKDKKQYQRPNSEIQRVLSANNFCKDIRIQNKLIDRYINNNQDPQTYKTQTIDLFQGFVQTQKQQNKDNLSIDKVNKLAFIDKKTAQLLKKFTNLNGKNQTIPNNNFITEVNKAPNLALSAVQLNITNQSSTEQSNQSVIKQIHSNLKKENHNNSNQKNLTIQQQNQLNIQKSLYHDLNNHTGFFNKKSNNLSQDQIMRLYNIPSLKSINQNLMKVIINKQQ